MGQGPTPVLMYAVEGHAPANAGWVIAARDTKEVPADRDINQ